MRNVAMLVVLLGCSSVAVADGSPPEFAAQVATNDDATRDEATLQRLIVTAAGDVAPVVARLERRAHRRRVAGAVLLGVGAPALAGGLATLAGAAVSADLQGALASLNCDDQHSCPAVQANRTAMIAGGVFAAAGLATTLSGAVLLSLARDDRAQMRKLALSAAPVVGPGYEGVAIAGRF